MSALFPAIPADEQQQLRVAHEEPRGSTDEPAGADRVIRGAGTSEATWHAWPGLAALRVIGTEGLMAGKTRAVVVAPHPDDEVIAVGGLLAMLARAGVPTCVVAVTDGTASHPGSPEWPERRLARVRPQETRSALQRLGMEVEPVRLRFPDGGLSASQGALAARLSTLLTRTDALFTTWRSDGHPDHEATGQAAASAAASSGARLIEVPVWAWHWGIPGDARMPWHRARRLPLDAEASVRKCEALRCFRSQLEPDASTGAAPILGAGTALRVARPFEIFFV